MEQIISEHLSSLRNFRSLGLIFELEISFIKGKSSIYFSEIEVYQKEEFERIYLNGKKDGLSISWYENGQKADERNYRNGKQEGSGAYGEAGLWISWHPNGQKHLEGNYRNGKKEGLWIDWYLNSQKSSEGNYRNGKEKEAELTAKPDYGLIGMKMVKKHQKEIIEMENFLMRLSFKFFDR